MCATPLCSQLKLKMIKGRPRGSSMSAVFLRRNKTITSLSLFGQKWAEWLRFSVSSRRIYGRYDADPGQRQLALRLHHLGRGPERLPVRGRNIWQSQGASDVFSEIDHPECTLSFNSFFPSESRGGANVHVHGLYGRDLLGRETYWTVELQTETGRL